MKRREKPDIKKFTIHSIKTAKSRQSTALGSDGYNAEYAASFFSQERYRTTVGRTI